MKRWKLVSVLALAIGAMVLTTGCRDKIFKEKEAPESSKRLTVDQLKNKAYYVKDGTGFYSLYAPDKSFTGKANTSNSQDRIIWNLESEDSLIPTLYKNEVIAYSTDDTSSVITDYSLERFKDIGWSLGAKGFTENDTGGYDVSMSDGIRKSSSLYDIVSGAEGISTVSFTSLNGKSLTKDDMSLAGIVKNLTKDKSYTCGVYVGTKYDEIDVTADTHYYQSSEILKLDSTFELTRNGYMQIAMPDNLKTGYYYMNGVGMFRYIAEEKANAVDLAEYDYNEANDEVEYATLDDTTETTEKKYQAKVEKSYEYLEFAFPVSKDMEISSAVLIAPSGKQYDFVSTEESLNTLKARIDGNTETGTYQILLKGKNINDLRFTVQKGTEIKSQEEIDAEKAKQEQEAAQQAAQAPSAETSSGVADSGSQNYQEGTSSGVTEEVTTETTESTGPEMTEAEQSGTMGR